MDLKLINRAQRMARSDPNRSRVNDVLRDQCTGVLIEAASEGAVPVGAVSHLLIETFGRDVMTAPMMRQFCGLACAAILSEAGFEPAQTGVRVASDPLFTFGATYRRRAEHQAAGDNSILIRLINALTRDELRQAEALIQKRLKEDDH